MRNWFRARWRAYLESSDPVTAMAGSTPVGIVLVVAILTGIFLSLAYVPALARVSQFQNVWVAVALTVAAGSLTFIAWRHECRGTIGSLATLLDNSFYSAALAFAALNTRGTVAISLAVVHGIGLALFQGQIYAFTFLLAVVMVVPIAVLLAVFQPALPVAMVLICSTLIMLIVSDVTRNRRQFAGRQKELEEALGAANRVAEESVQAALTSTLLTLGHFLHELSNYQTAISTNLDYIRVRAELCRETGRALEDAQAAQSEQEKLLKSTIADLRSRARPAHSSFLLSQVLLQAASGPKAARVVVSDADFAFEVTGNPEHLRVVLLNLIRNAEQAGARTVRLDVHLDPGGQSAQLTVHNDGKPIPGELQDRLFDTFAVSTKPGGNGLGLYLVRRYVELLGGRVLVRQGPLGGAAFVMHLPGKVVGAPVSERRVRSVQPARHKSA
jgi:signal transduction histidine kinase